MAQVTFATDTTPSLTDLDANFTELYGKTAWATTGIGYATGAGGSVTQITSKATGVTLNKTCGRVITHNASLAANTAVTFTLTDSAIAATDVVQVMADDANYSVKAFGAAAGSVGISLKNETGGALAQSVTISFAVIKAVTA